MKRFKKLGALLLVVMMLFSILSTTILVSAEGQEMSLEFSEILTDGKLVLNIAKPKTKDECSAYGATFERYTMEYNFSYLDDYADMSKVLLYNWKIDESHIVDVVWNCNEKVLNKIDELISNFPKDENGVSNFFLDDLEFINYIANNQLIKDEDGNLRESAEMSNFCGEFKSATDNTNVYLKMDVRAGGDKPFWTIRHGYTILCHDETAYHIWDNNLNVQANHIIYVPESTPDDAKALLKAAQKRIDDYVGAGKVTITDSGKTIAQYYTELIDRYVTEGNTLQQEIDELNAIIVAEEEKAPELRDESLIEQTQNQIQTLTDSQFTASHWEKDYREEYNDGNYKFEFLNDAAGDFLFNIRGANIENDYTFIIVKDDSKLAVPTYENKDVITDLTTSTDSSEVPLDAIIQVDKIGGGKEHDRICVSIGAEDVEMYDIKFHSNAKNEYITKLKNGKFRVSIPIPEKFENKKLIVYFVDKHDEVSEHEVTVKDGYAVFETDHFSIYTLTTAPEPITPDSPEIPVTPDTPDSPDTPDNNVAPPNTTDNDIAPSNTGDNNMESSDIGNNDIKSPNTHDNSNIILWSVLFILSGGCLIGAVCAKKRRTF